ncbi:MAG: hypothetical protein GF331_16075 [Chitinivibrionales bacterium]|nr:hypothetical protein [Chitinivibrionales bacterium]
MRTMRLAILGLLITVTSSMADDLLNPPRLAYTQWGVYGGMSHIIDEERLKWDVGYRLGGYLYFLATPQTGLGLQVSWEHVTPDADGWGDVINEAIANISSTEPTGHTSVLSIIPTFRWSSGCADCLVNPFGEIGVGLHLRESVVWAEGDRLIIDMSQARVAMSMALGLSIGEIDKLRLEIFPAYHLAFPLDEALDYYSLNIGVSLRI